MQIYFFSFPTASKQVHPCKYSIHIQRKVILNRTKKINFFIASLNKGMDFLFCRLGGNPCCNNANLQLYYAHLNCRYNSTSVSTPNTSSNTQLLFTSAMLNSIYLEKCFRNCSIWGSHQITSFLSKELCEMGVCLMAFLLFQG
jgi:hypothetical protein